MKNLDPSVAEPALSKAEGQAQDDEKKERTHIRPNSRQKRLLDHLKKHGEITRHDYARMMKASVPTAARDLKQLVDQGLIKGVGPLGPGRVYVLA